MKYLLALWLVGTFTFKPRDMLWEAKLILPKALLSNLGEGGIAHEASGLIRTVLI